MQKYSIVKDSMYNAWPDIAMAENGTLLCVFTECAHHLDRSNSAIVLVKSYDGGKTWTNKERISEVSLDGKGHFNNARIQKLKNGEMIILCDKLPDFHGSLQEAQTYIWNGGKDGESWSEPRPLDIWGIVPDRMLELESGRLIVAAHYVNENTNKVTQYCYASDDNMLTWKQIIVASDLRFDLCEASIIEVEPNVLVALMRENSGMGYDCKKSISRDGGNTWEGVYDMPIPGCHRPVAGFLSDGNVLISYRFMQGGCGGFGSTFQNVFLAITSKEDLLQAERKKQRARIYPLDFDRSSKADTGYTGWVEISPDKIYVVNYIVDDWTSAQIRGYLVDKKDIILE